MKLAAAYVNSKLKAGHPCAIALVETVQRVTSITRDWSGSITGLTKNLQQLEGIDRIVVSDDWLQGLVSELLPGSSVAVTRPNLDELSSRISRLAPEGAIASGQWRGWKKFLLDIDQGTFSARWAAAMLALSEGVRTASNAGLGDVGIGLTDSLTLSGMRHGTRPRYQ